MITLLFIIMLLAIVGKIIKLAIKMTWGITRFVFSVILFPLVVIGIALSGFMYIALAILVIVGLIGIFSGLATAD